MTFSYFTGTGFPPYLLVPYPESSFPLPSSLSPYPLSHFRHASSLYFSATPHILLPHYLSPSLSLFFLSSLSLSPLSFVSLILLSRSFLSSPSPLSLFLSSLPLLSLPRPLSYPFPSPLSISLLFLFLVVFLCLEFFLSLPLSLHFIYRFLSCLSSCVGLLSHAFSLSPTASAPCVSACVVSPSCLAWFLCHSLLASFSSCFPQCLYVSICLPISLHSFDRSISERSKE